MSWENLFSIASTVALAGWLALIFLPRWGRLIQGLRYGIPGLLALAYTILIGLYFFGVEGGGFNSIAEVRKLFTSDPVLLGGWIHYLAFDLFVGTFIAERLDIQKVSRFLQAPILLATFIFGPVGYLLYLGVEVFILAGRSRLAKGV